MPNWPVDDDHDFDFEQEKIRPTRASIIRGPQHRRSPEWNGRPIHSMDDDHVMNSILFCEKKFVEARDNFVKCHSTDSENFYFESVMDMFPAYQDLKVEWDRRNRNSGR